MNNIVIHCYCTCLREIFEVNYFEIKYNKHSATPLMPSIFLSILIWGSEKWYKKPFWWSHFSRCSYVMSLSRIFASKGNFPMLYCCKDCKSVIRDKKFLQSRFFCFFFRLCKFSKKFFRLGTRKFYFPKYNNFFQSRFF